MTYSLVHAIYREKCRRFQHQVHAAFDVELLQQRGNMKFYRSHRNIQLRRNFLIAQILRNIRKHFTLSRAQRKPRHIDTPNSFG
jgi:hypothetical protein